MKFAAAYLLACLGTEQAAGAKEGAGAAVPNKDDVLRILGSVGAEVEEGRLDLLFALMDGKNVAERIATGRELAYAPSGAAAPAAAAVEAKDEEEDRKEEEAKKEEEEDEEDGEGLFNLFD